MSTHEKDTFVATYEWAKGWEDLPWSHDEPTLFLGEVCRRRAPGKALDIGCGGGKNGAPFSQAGENKNTPCPLSSIILLPLDLGFYTLLPPPLENIPCQRGSPH